MSDAIEYVIYCRKSTEENTEKQVQSIPDQIRVCIEYAKNNGLKIKQKPKDFSMFESISEREKELNNVDIADRQFYKETQNLFIVKEQKSAKIPGKREKRKKVIKMIEEGKIKGLLSYSPDRQSRNMLEAGEIIDLVDREDVDLTLKYTNFHFDPNASGKMMLGIWFVFSKQYSDAISENVGRGKERTVSERGKSDGNTKHGYLINEEGFHEPHPIYFDLIKEAFHLRIYENKSNKQIKDFLDKKGYVREYKSGKKPTRITEGAVGSLWDDSFYYGIFVEGDSQNDLRKNNTYYKATITEEEYSLLVEKKLSNKPTLGPSEIKDEYEQYVMPFDRGFIRSESGYSMTFYLTNKKRFLNKLKELKKTNPNANLGDVVGIHQIRYKDANKKSKTMGLEITADIIDKTIAEALNNIKIDDKLYNEYIKYAGDKFENATQEKAEERKKIQLQYNAVSKRRNEYIKKSASTSLIGEEEANVYNREKNRYEAILLGLKRELDALDIKERNDIYELEAFIGLMKDASKRYGKGDLVQKRTIASIIFLNIVVDNKKRLHLAVKPIFESLLMSNGGGYKTRTCDPLLVRQML